MIQTFPPDFVLLGSKTDQEQMIGNAVPVKLAEYVGRHLRTYIEQQAAAGLPSGRLTLALLLCTPKTELNWFVCTLDKLKGLCYHHSQPRY